MPKWRDSKGNESNVLLDCDLTPEQHRRFFYATEGMVGGCPLSERLRAMIYKLPAKQRQAMVMYLYLNPKDLSQDKIAKKLGIDVSTFKKRLSRAKRNLQILKINKELSKPNPPQSLNDKVWEKEKK